MLSETTVEPFDLCILRWVTWLNEL